MEITLVAALDENRLIGTGHGIPWRLPRDSRHFRATVAGHHVLVGRRTFGEMAGWFRTEKPIVLTRDPAFEPAGAHAAASFAAAADHARSHGESEFMVIGGASVYREAMPAATRMVLTRVHGRFKGAAWFPDFDEDQWVEESRAEFPADPENAYAMTVTELRRVGDG